MGCTWSRGSGGFGGGKEDPVPAKILFLSLLKYTEYTQIQVLNSLKHFNRMQVFHFFQYLMLL